VTGGEVIPQEVKLDALFEHGWTRGEEGKEKHRITNRENKDIFPRPEKPPMRTFATVYD